MPTLPVAIDARKALAGAAMFTTATGMITGGARRAGASLKLMALGLAAMGAAAGAASLKLVKVASDAEETQQKFNVVFKSQAKATNAWANSFARDVGRAEQDVKAWSATLQDTLVPMGFSRTEATKLTKTLVALGVDVASFSNKMDADVINNFTSAIVGQHRAVRSYGIVINEQSIQNESYRQGINKQYKDLTNLEKAQLRAAVIFSATADAQGDAIRTAGQYANQLKRLSGNIKNIAGDVGDLLLPSFSKAMRGINAWLQDNRHSFTFWGKRIQIEIETAMGYFSEFKNFLTADFSGAMGAVWDVFLKSMKVGAIAVISLAQGTGRGIAAGLKEGLVEGLFGASTMSDKELEARTAERYVAQGGRTTWRPIPKGGLGYQPGQKVWAGDKANKEYYMSTMEKTGIGDPELWSRLQSEIKEEDVAKKRGALAVELNNIYEKQAKILSASTKAFKENSVARLDEQDPKFVEGLKKQAESRKKAIAVLESEREAYRQASVAREWYEAVRAKISPYLSSAKEKMTGFLPGLKGGVAPTQEDSLREESRGALRQQISDMREENKYLAENAANWERANATVGFYMETSKALGTIKEGEFTADIKALKTKDDLVDAMGREIDARERLTTAYGKKETVDPKITRDSLRQQIQTLRFEGKYLNENSDRRERAIATMAFEKEAQEGLTGSKKLALDVDLQTMDSYEELSKAYEDAIKILERQQKAYNAGVEAGNAFGNTLMHIAENAKNTEDALDSMRLLMVDVIKIAIKYAFIQPLGEALGGALSGYVGGLGTSSAGGANYRGGNTGGAANTPTMSGGYGSVRSAKGNVFTNGSLSYFAKGGLTKGVTAFAMGGGVGIMGEKETEGIFPLGRNSKGELGVKSISGGAGQQPVIVNYQPPQIIIENSSGTEMEAGPTTDDGSSFIVRIVAKNMQSGGATYKAWQQRQAMSKR